MALGEFQLIQKFFAAAPARRARLGVGDDCALLANGPAEGARAVTTDMLVCGRHFLPTVDPESLGHKALAVNLSDLAAMGAIPEAFTLALALPDVDEAWLEGFARGLLRLSSAADCELVGGDTTRGPLNICITAIGRVDEARALRRDRARPGDDLWVSGELGAAAFAVREAAAGRPLAPDHPAQRRLDWPDPRLLLGRELSGLAHAAIDVSDGLAGDVAHLVERSGVAIRIVWDDVPTASCLDHEPDGERMRLALSGGDDYELLFAVGPKAGGRLRAARKSFATPLTRIGVLTAAPALVLHRDGIDTPLPTGFEHFVSA